MNQGFLSLDNKDSLDKIMKFNYILDNNNSFSNYGDESSSINDYPINEQNIDNILPLIFKYESKSITNDESNTQVNILEKQAIQAQPKKFFVYRDCIESIQHKIKEDIYSKKPFKEKKLIGRKKKSNEGSGEHNKFSDDNLIRKCKHILLDNIWKFINNKINNMYSEDSDVTKKKKLCKLSQKQVKSSNVAHNKLFLKKTLKSIFSANISGKYSRHNLNHNKNLIESLMNEKDETKRIYFQKLFNLTFLECLAHFRGSNSIEELIGMKNFNEYLNENEFGINSEEYKKILKLFIYNFERIVMEKRSRRGKNKIKK